jgi:hypothetical protein
VTLAVLGVLVISAGLYLVIGDMAGLVVGKTMFALGLLGQLGLLIWWGSRGEIGEGMQLAPVAGQRRLLVLANAGLERVDVPRLAGRTDEAMIVAPVAAASWLHAVADDVDVEFQTAQKRVDAVVDALRQAGVTAQGMADIARPATALIDGLREFPATEILVLPSREKGWANANALVEQMQAQFDLSVDEPGRPQTILATA